MTAEVHDQGAQVTLWAPTDAEPVLWLGPHARFVAGQAIRGGVPICFPWFGAGRGGDLSPGHGFARTTGWRLVSEAATGGVVTLDYEITDADIAATAFPGPYRAAYRLALGSHLELALTVTNTGSAAFEVEEALHTYLMVGDVRETVLEGLEGAEYTDKVHGGVRRQDGAVRFEGRTDRVYRSPGPVRLVDPVLGRSLVIETAGAANVVVWTPWSDLGSRTADIGADSWSRFVCVEAANALDDFVSVPPGGSHTLGYRLAVSG